MPHKEVVWYISDKSLTPNVMKNLRGYRVLLVLLLLLATTCTYAIEMKVVFQSSAGEPIEGAEVKYLTNNWKNFGLTDENGEVTKDLLEGLYSFKLIYDGQSVVKDDIAV